MELGHYEGLSQVVEMLTHSDNVVAFTTSAIVNHAALHARAESTYRVLVHAVASSLDYAIALKPIRHVN